MDDFYIEENMKEILKSIAYRAKVSIDDIEDDIFNHDYVDNLIYSVISDVIQLSFYVLIKKIYEKRSNFIYGGIKND